MKYSRLLAAVLSLLFLTHCSLPRDLRSTDSAPSLFSGSSGAAFDELNDTAHFLAGMPGGNSKFSKLRQSAAWQTHQREMDKMFAHFKSARQGPISGWQSGELRGASSSHVFYPFGGPDFLHANAFFPRARTYTLCGLEPAYPLPDLTSLSPAELEAGLSNLRHSFRNVIYDSYFITKNMSADLNRTRIRGTLPVLMVALARTGHRLQSVNQVGLSSSGQVTEGSTGFHIVAGGNHIYYFREDLSNGNLAGDPGILRFVANRGRPVTFLKSASYLMHGGGFSIIRDGILDQSTAVVTDPSGVPFRYFDSPSWKVTLYGDYTGTLGLFSDHYQSDLASGYENGRYQVKPLPFGVGYKRTTLIVARKQGGGALSESESTGDEDQAEVIALADRS